jgi:hypothetical protein
MLLGGVRNRLVKEVATKNGLQVSTPNPWMGSEGRKVNVHFQLFHSSTNGGSQAVYLLSANYPIFLDFTIQRSPP